MTRTSITKTWTTEERLRLRRRRLDLGYSQAEIARRLNIHPSSLSNIENGIQSISHALHRRLSDLLRTLGPKPCRRPPWAGRKAFRARRLELGFSQRRVAAIVGVGTDLLMQWENGKLAPTVGQQRALARVLRRLEVAAPDLRAPYSRDEPKAGPDWHRTLRARRLTVGLSQDALGLRAGMSGSTIGSYELGQYLAATFQAARIDAVIERERARLAGAPIPLTRRSA